MNWLQRFRRRWSREWGPQGISIKHLTHGEVAERNARRLEDIAEARREAFQGARRIPLSHVAEVPTLGDLVYLGVGYDDRLVVATSSANPDRTYAGRDESPGFASFPHSMATERYRVEVLTLDANLTTSTRTIEEVPVAHPFVQPAPDGSVLLVGARARYADGQAEENAWLISPGGSIVSSFCAGDGIQSVQVDGSGRVWVGYFDEGVFGNFGWGSADSPPPLGQPGLVCWSITGERLYDYSPPPGFGPIDDCYAMSVGGDELWTCYYSDFPVVRVGRGFSVTGWTCGISGAHAMAVGDDGRVGLIGGYHGLSDRLVVAELGDGETTRSTTCQLVMPSGRDLPSNARLVARGRYVNALIDQQWLRVDIGDVPPL